MKTVLISPPEQFHLMEAGDRPDMGTLYVASAIHEAGYDVQISDLNHDSYNDLNKKLKDADIIGITTKTPYFQWFINFVQHLKHNFPNAKYVAGGPHATKAPNSLENLFDHIIIGEGEQAILDIINGTKEKFIQRQYETNLDNIPLPNWNLLDNEYGINQEGHKTLPILTSRSCPYACSFCTKDILGKTQRRHSIGRVVKEISNGIENGYNSFYFLDDCFVLSERRIKDLYEIVKSENLNFTFRATSRTNTLTPKIMKYLKEMGMRSISFGLEHADDNVLKMIDKRTNIKNHKKAIELAHNYDVKVRGSFIVNLPGSTKETAYKTLDFAMENNIEFADFYSLVAYPGTPIWNNPKKFKVKVDKVYGFNQLGLETNVDSRTMRKNKVPKLIKSIRNKWKEFKGTNVPWQE